MRALWIFGLIVFGCGQIVGIEEPLDPLPEDSGAGGMDASADAATEDAAVDSAPDTTTPDAGKQPNEYVPCEGTGCTCKQEPVAAAENEVFLDVPPTALEAEAVNALHAQGVIGGCDDDPPLFCPGCQVSRSAFVKWLVVAGKYELISRDVPTFPDVPKNHPFYKYIETAWENEIVEGYLPDGTFRPNEPVSRGAAAVLLTKAAKLEIPNPLPQSYGDVAPESWWEKGIEALRLACVTTGCMGGTMYCPAQLLSRRSGAVMVARAFGFVAPACTPDP